MKKKQEQRYNYDVMMITCNAQLSFVLSLTIQMFEVVLLRTLSLSDDQRVGAGKIRNGSGGEFPVCKEIRDQIGRTATAHFSVYSPARIAVELCLGS